MSPSHRPTAIYIDPPSPAYYGNKLFDLSDPVLNRDDSLVPYAQVRENCRLAGMPVHTADLLPGPEGGTFDYYSLGVMENFRSLAQRPDIRLQAFVIFEPPVVEPRLYLALPELTAAFKEVYVHNTVGDGYSLEGVDTTKLRKLYWPQPRQDVIEQWWSRIDRQNRIVVINGNHVPRNVPNELYSKRIEAMVELASLGAVDLYGRGWKKLKARTSFWWPFISRRRQLLSIYQGACESKYEVLSQYNFCLCLENMVMQGYVTEKIFDCFYAGTIPLYLGASDIEHLIPKDAYIDCRDYPSWKEVFRSISAMSGEKIQRMREHGRSFIRSDKGRMYQDSLLTIVPYLT